MKKIFEFFGLITLIFFSFFITDKTVNVVKNMDDIMINIKQNYKKYETNSINAEIKDNTIIPGISGMKVNINKSYKNMRQIGLYHSNYYVYNYIKPKISIEDNKNKIIVSGNKKYHKISLSVVLNDNSDIIKLYKICENNNIKINFLVTEKWLLNNKNLTSSLIKNNYIIGIMSKNYKLSTINYMNKIIKKINKQKNGYCLSKNKKQINYCAREGNYNINSVIYEKEYLNNIKKDIGNGSLITIKYNSNLYKEMESIIKYIKSKGYEINTLNNVISE